MILNLYDCRALCWIMLCSPSSLPSFDWYQLGKDSVGDWSDQLKNPHDDPSDLSVALQLFSTSTATVFYTFYNLLTAYYKKLKYSTKI